jgi:hypothetical protein
MRRALGAVDRSCRRSVVVGVAMLALAACGSSAGGVHTVASAPRTRSQPTTTATSATSTSTPSTLATTTATSAGQSSNSGAGASGQTGSSGAGASGQSGNSGTGASGQSGNSGTGTSGGTGNSGASASASDTGVPQCPSQERLSTILSHSIARDLANPSTAPKSEYCSYSVRESGGILGDLGVVTEYPTSSLSAFKALNAYKVNASYFPAVYDRGIGFVFGAFSGPSFHISWSEFIRAVTQALTGTADANYLNPNAYYLHHNAAGA